MATSYKLRYSGQVIPTEEVTLDDGSDVSYNINSNLDKIFGSSQILTIGTSSAKVVTKDYLTTTGAVAMSDATILNTSTGLVFIFIKIVSAGSSSTPQVEIAFSGTSGTTIVLAGVGSFCIMPGLFAPGSVTISSVAGATYVANVEILAGTV
jgi:hypothetical protein